MKKHILNLINSHIKQLEYIGGLIGWALVKKNGILIKSSLPREINAKIFGAMSATIFEGIDTAIESLNHEEENKQKEKETDSLSNITIELDDSQVVIMSVTEDIIIVVALQLEVNLGLILIELEEIIKMVNEILSESAN